MTASSKAADAEVAQAAAESARPLAREDVASIIGEIVGSLTGELSGAHLKLYDELEALAHYIEAAKREIASIRPDDIADTFIPSATDELGAIVDATADATGTILDCCEKIEQIAGTVSKEASGDLTDCVTQMYEACNFQDITGQRITKVVTALKHIDGKIQALLTAFGRPPSATTAAAPKGDERSGDAALLNGPQMPGMAIDQAEIDRLLASFD